MLVNLQSSAAVTKRSKIMRPKSRGNAAYPGNWFPFTKPWGTVLDLMKQGEGQACPFKDITLKLLPVPSALIPFAWALSKGHRSLQGRLRNVISTWRAMSPAPRRTLLSREEGLDYRRSITVPTTLNSDGSWPALHPQTLNSLQLFSNIQRRLSQWNQESKAKDGGGF